MVKMVKKVKKFRFWKGSRYPHSPKLLPNESLRKELIGSFDQPKRLLEHVFKSLALKEKQFEIFQAACNGKIYVDKEVLLQKFDDNILSLSLRNDFTKMKYPKFYEFYNKHCVSRTYHFHIFKCSKVDCPWHEPIRFREIAKHVINNKRTF